MASANSLRCLVRPSIPRAPRIQPIILSAVSFSTSSSLSAGVPAVKSRRDLPSKQKKSYKKKANIVSVRKPNPGERKAFRKRMQLSNNSALPVNGLEALTAKNMAETESNGKVFSIPDQVVDQLRALEAFKTTQTWNLFRRPHVLLRRETTKLTQKLEASVESKEAFRCVLTGNRLSGKSILLLQAKAYALLNNWVVFHIPEGQDLTNGNTEYSPISDTEPMQFAQPVYCLKMIQNIYRANRSVLEKLHLEKDWSRFTNLKQGATLADLALSAKEAEYAWPTLHALWTELTLPGRPPVLFTLDGLAHINKISEYRDPSFNEVHAHELSLVRMFVDALSGKTALPNGGGVIAATSRNNSPSNPTQSLALDISWANEINTLKTEEEHEGYLERRQRRMDRGIPEVEDPDLKIRTRWVKVPRMEAYSKYDQRVYDALYNTTVLGVKSLTREEARALMEYWAASGLVRSIINWRTVSEKWTVGGNGNVGEMERATLLQMRM